MAAALLRRPGSRCVFVAQVVPQNRQLGDVVVQFNRMGVQDNLKLQGIGCGVAQVEGVTLTVTPPPSLL